MCASNDEPVCVDYLNDMAPVQQYMMSVEEVDTVIRSHMKRGKAAGVDNISLEHIVYSHPAVVWHLCRLFNLMILHGYVPNQYVVLLYRWSRTSMVTYLILVTTGALQSALLFLRFLNVVCC